MGAKLATGGSGKRGSYSTNAEPNVVPFIDIMLVLLIIFMVAAPIATVDIEVKLPPSKTQPKIRPPKPVFVSLQDDLSIYVGNDRVSTSQLPEKVVEAVKAANPTLENLSDERVYVRAAASVEYKEVMRIMNELQDSGFYKIGLVAEDTRQ